MTHMTENNKMYHNSLQSNLTESYIDPRAVNTDIGLTSGRSSDEYSSGTSVERKLLLKNEILENENKHLRSVINNLINRL